MRSPISMGGLVLLIPRMNFVDDPMGTSFAFVLSQDDVSFQCTATCFKQIPGFPLTSIHLQCQLSLHGNNLILRILSEFE